MFGKFVVVCEVIEIDDHVEASVCEAHPITRSPTVETISTVEVAEGVTVNRHPVSASVGEELKPSAVAATSAVASPSVNVPHPQ